MKRKLSFILVLLVIFMTGIFAGCGKTEDKQIKDTIDGYINTYYTVGKADFDYYEKMIHGAKDSEMAEFMNLYEKNTEKFKKYFTKDGYAGFVNDRASYLRVKDAYDKKVYVTVKSINISKYTEDKEQKMLVYNVDMELLQKPVNGGEEKTVKETKQIKLFKENGVYKIG